MRLRTAAVRQCGLLCAKVTDVRRCAQKFKKCECVCAGGGGGGKKKVFTKFFF